MIPPKQYYRENAGNIQLRANAYKNFIKKYQLGQPDPDGFKLNERINFKHGSSNFFIPGKIYTFQYTPLYKDRLDYYDTRPIILCHDVYRAKGTGNDIVVGVNLNFLPEKVKVGTLQLFYEKFSADINAGEKAANTKSIFLATKLITALRNWLETIKIFEHANIHYGFAYRQYIRSRIKLSSLVEYDDWNDIPFIKAQDIMGKDLNEIYNEYYAISKGNK
ncbi:MAG: hypothetical protein WC979_01175 [Candidatus Pacearchaeota archaeon]|jgi:hypothetical protein|nr:hypothetical protein [Clostridia bacterium]